MPKRRTEDVIHAIMTDHRIQRRSPPAAAGLTAPRSERIEEGASAYRGEVALYYPPVLPDAERELYTAFAQVAQSSNLEAGIRRLAAAIDKHNPPGPEFLTELGLALLSARRPAEAEPRLTQALSRDRRYLPALRGLADAARQQGQSETAIQRMREALALRPRDAATLHELGRAQRSTERVRRAVEIDPWFSEAWNSLGSMHAESGNAAEAERAWREAVRHQPDLAEARVNLGNAVAAAGRFDEAQWHADAAAKANPRYAGAWELLGNLASRNKQWARAAEHFRKALAAQPDSGSAHLGLGTALLVLGDPAGARAHLTGAAQTGSPPVQAEASDLLRELAARGPR
jgi:Tfp pilus assembly protein PilF